MVVARGKRYGIAILAVIIGLLLAVSQGSRAFTVGYAAALLFIVAAFCKFRLKTRDWLLGCGLLLVLTLGLTGLLKTDSSAGRILIYKISWHMLGDHYLTGIPGRFKQVYLHYQAAYFRAGDYTEQELLLADNTYYAFNDYFQFVLRWGVPGILMLILTAAMLVHVIKKAFTHTSSPSAWLVLACSQLVALSVAALFTHVFEKLWYQLLFAATVLVIIGYAYGSRTRRVLPGYVGGTLLVLMSLTAAHEKSGLWHYRALRLQEEARILLKAGYTTQALECLEGVYPRLKNRPDFQEIYARALLVKGDTSKTKEILEQAVQQIPRSDLYMKLATCYMQLGDPEKAEEALLLSVYMVPNRFNSRFALFEFYESQEEKEKVRYWGQSILSLPAKVPSARVSQVKAAVKGRLESDDQIK